MYKVSFSYNADAKTDINLKVGDIITQVEDVGNGWSLGYNVSSGKTGTFPTEFITKKESFKNKFKRLSMAKRSSDKIKRSPVKASEETLIPKEKAKIPDNILHRRLTYYSGNKQVISVKLPNSIIRPIKLAQQTILRSGEDRLLRDLFRFLGGLMVSGVLFVFLRYSYDYTSETSGWITLVSSVPICVGMILSTHMRCIILLMVTNLFTGKGRTVLLSIIFAKLLAGPVFNIAYNAQQASESMACAQELIYNQTHQLKRQLEEPIRRIQQTIYNGLVKVRDVAQGIKDSIQPVLNGIDSLTSGLEKAGNALRTVAKKCSSGVESAKSECINGINGAKRTCERELKKLDPINHIINFGKEAGKFIGEAFKKLFGKKRKRRQAMTEQEKAAIESAKQLIARVESRKHQEIKINVKPSKLESRTVIHNKTLVIRTNSNPKQNTINKKETHKITGRLTSISHQPTTISLPISHQPTTISLPISHQPTTISLPISHQTTTSSLTTPIQTTTSSMTTPIQLTISSLTTPLQQITSSLTTPIQLKISSLTTPLQQITSSLTTPIQTTTSSMTTPIQPTTSSLTTPIQTTTSSLTTPIQQTASSLTTPIQQTTSSLTISLQPTTSSLTTPMQTTTSSLTPIQQTTSSLTTPIQQTTTSLTTPHQPTTSSLTTRLQQTTSSLTTPLQPTTSSLTTPLQPTTNSLTTPLQPTTSSLTTPHQQTTSSLITPFQQTTHSLRTHQHFLHRHKRFTLLDKICIVLDISFICHVVQVGKFVACKPLEFFSDLMGLTAHGIKEAVSSVTNYFYFDFEGNYESKGNINSSKTAKHLVSEVQADILSKLAEFSKNARVFRYILSMTSLILFIKSAIYLRKFLSKDHYDNFYITTSFKQYDLECKANRNRSVLPLKRRERSKYVDTRSPFLVSKEIAHFKQGFGKVLIHLLIAAVIIAFDYTLYFVLSLIDRYGNLNINIGGNSKHEVAVDGKGFIAAYLRAFLSTIDLNTDFNVQFNLSTCIPKVSKPNEDNIYIFSFLYFFGFIFVVMQAYGLRLRCKIATFFYPERDEERNKFLQEKICLKRKSYFSWMRQHILSRNKQFHIENRITIRGWLQYKYPVYARFFSFCLPTKKQCLNCDVDYDGKKRFSVCPVCNSNYCEEYFIHEMKNNCVVCDTRNKSRK